MYNQAEQTTLGVYSAYDLPYVADLVRYFHAALGYSVRSTWLNGITSVNYESYPGLTYNNASRYFPSADKTIKVHMVHTRQGVRSTKQFLLEHPENTAAVPDEQQTYKTTQELGSTSNKLHIRSIHPSKLYINCTDRLPVRSRIGNQYVMVAYHSSNVILVAPFKTRKYQHRISAYNSIMQPLKNRVLTTDLQLVDNEVSQHYKDTINNKWGVDF